MQAAAYTPYYQFSTILHQNVIVTVRLSAGFEGFDITSG